MSKSTTKKINPYYDDITIFSTGPASLIKICQTLETFNQASGMKINPGKTDIFNNTNQTTLFNTNLDFVIYLGHKITSNNISTQDGYLDKFTNMSKKIATSWSSLLGKRLALQTYAFSTVYHLAPIIFPLQPNIKKLTTQLSNYALWKITYQRNNQTIYGAKLKLTTLAQTKKNGGINLIHLPSQLQALNSKTAIN